MSNENDQAPAQTEELATQDTQAAAEGSDSVDGGGSVSGADDAPAAEAPAVADAATEPESAPVPAAAPAVEAPATTEAPVVGQAAPAPTPPPAPTAKLDEKPQAKTNAGISGDMVDYVRGRFRSGKDLNPRTVQIAERMRAYCTAMGKNNAMGSTEGAGYQRDLYMTFMSALAGPDETVHPSLEAICWFFYHHRNDCFADSHAYRFMNAVRLTKDQSLALSSLIHIFKTCCDPVGRRNITKQIDLNRATEKITDLRQRDLLLAFLTDAR